MAQRGKRAARRIAPALALLLAATLLAACSSDESGPPTLVWYINPDNGGQATLADQCSERSDGAYRIETQVLPLEADAQREQLVRRLAANDSSVDLMSLDPVFVAEFANAGYLLPITDEADVRELTRGVLDAPLETAYWEDELVATPFWANTQLLWYRQSVADEAGIDPRADDVTWDQVIDAAEQTGTRVAVQGRRYEGYMVWINALVDSAGGQVLEHADRGVDATPSMAGEAGDAAADVVHRLGTSSAAPGDLSTAGEEEARSTFQGDSGGFMVNWPYVYAAAKGEVDSGALDQEVFDDIAWARYPQVLPGEPSAPPLGGIDLGIGNFTDHPDEALRAVRCITSVDSTAQYMIEAGNPAARDAVYDDPEVREVFPMADLIRDSINEAGPRPVTPYYGDVSTSVQRIWHPASGVSSPDTPEETDTFMTEVLQGDRLL